MQLKIAASAAAALIMTCTASGAQAGAIVADYGSLADGTAASISLAGTTVTGSADVTVSSYLGHRGLGVVGTHPSSLDRGETLTIDYGQLVTNVTLTAYDIPAVGNAGYQFTAFDGLAGLGTFDIPLQTLEVETNDLTSIAGGLAFSRIMLACVSGAACDGSQTATLGILVQQTSYDPASNIPEPGTMALFGLGLAGLGFAVRKRYLERSSRSNCPT